jgi:hypothetical protein
MPDGKKILFSSNRINDTLTSNDNIPLNISASHDLFIYDPDNVQKVLRRLTSTPNVHESQAFPIDNQRVSWLSDASGLQNRYQGRFDSTIAYIDTTIHYRYFMVSRPITNSNRSIVEHCVGLKGSAVDVKFDKGRPNVYLSSTEVGFLENESLPLVLLVDSEAPLEKNKTKVPDKIQKSKLKKVFVFGEKN